MIATLGKCGTKPFEGAATLRIDGTTVGIFTDKAAAKKVVAILNKDVSEHTLDAVVQLHERIEIHYYVDGYEVQLWTNEKNVMAGRGETIKEAMMALECKVRGVPIQTIRRL